jgi:hypothetical protein
VPGAGDALDGGVRRDPDLDAPARLRLFEYGQEVPGQQAQVGLIGGVGGDPCHGGGDVGRVGAAQSARHPGQYANLDGGLACRSMLVVK